MASRGNQLDRRTVHDSRGHHPWRTIGMFPTWRVEFVDELPPGVADPDDFGCTLHDKQKILILNGLSCATRRSTLTHETGHVLRGPVGRRRRLAEEAYVEHQAARLLMPSVKKIGHALSWHAADHERAADDLWVDVQLFHARLSTMTPKERTYLDDQLASIWI